VRDDSTRSGPANVGRAPRIRAKPPLYHESLGVQGSRPAWTPASWLGHGGDAPLRPGVSNESRAALRHACASLPFSRRALADRPPPRRVACAAVLPRSAHSRPNRPNRPNRTQRRDAPIEVRIHDVVPVPLKTVYVDLDTEALRKLDEVHAEFGGGFIDRSNGAAQGPKSRCLEVNGTKGYPLMGEQQAQEQVWRNAVQDALQSPTMLRTGGLLPLPLSTHPITYIALR
jgi:hypothetical protein